MIKIDLTTVIKKPVEEVWRYMINSDNARKWMSGLLGASSTSGSPMRSGTSFRKVQRFWGLLTEMIYDLTEYEPNKKLAYKTVSGTISGLLSYEASITLEPIDGGTNLIYKGQGRLHGFLKLAEPILRDVMKRRFAHDFKRLRDLLELPGDQVIRV